MHNFHFPIDIQFFVAFFFLNRLHNAVFQWNVWLKNSCKFTMKNLTPQVLNHMDLAVAGRRATIHIKMLFFFNIVIILTIYVDFTVCELWVFFQFLNSADLNSTASPFNMFLCFLNTVLDLVILSNPVSSIYKLVINKLTFLQSCTYIHTSDHTKKCSIFQRHSMY